MSTTRKFKFPALVLGTAVAVFLFTRVARREGQGTNNMEDTQHTTEKINGAETSINIEGVLGSAEKLPEGAICEWCIDDRYKHHHNLRAARPGGSAGYPLVTLAALRELRVDVSDPEVIRKAIRATVKAIGGNSRFHSHTHCGHLAGIKESPEKYGLTSEMVKIYEAERSKYLTSGGEEEEFTDEHNASGVITVKGNMCIPHQNNGTQFFVYNEDTDKFGLELIAKKAKELGVNEQAFLQSLQKVSDKQNGITFAHVSGELPKLTISEQQDSATIQ